MSKIVHIDHGAESSAACVSAHRVAPRRLIAGIVLSVLLFFSMFGLMVRLVRSAPNDAGVDAKLARVKQQIAVRRAKDRAQSVAGIADTIVGAQGGRRAQEEMLKDEGTSLAGQ
jgi:hypothetical protein